MSTDNGMVRRGSSRQGRLVASVVFATLLGLGVGRVTLLAPSRAIDTDELEHLHVAWSISQGQLPYRDFFEHHTPLYHVILSTLCAALDPHESGDAAVACIRWARVIGLIAALLLVVAVATLGWQLRGAVGAAAAAAFALGSEVLVGKGLEIRPDAAAIALFVAASLGLVSVPSARGTSGRLRRALGSGFALGMAIMLTQKAAFLFPGLVVAIGLAWRRPGGGWRRTALRCAAACATGAAIPVAAVGVWLARHGALARFVELSVFENLRGGFRHPLADTAWIVLAADPFLVAAGGAGLIYGVLRSLRREEPDALALVVWLGLSGAVGVVMMPVPYPQALLLVLPFAAVLQSLLVVDLVGGRSAAPGQGRWRRAVAMAALAGGTWLVAILGPPVEAPDWAITAGSGVLATWGGAVAWALGWLGVDVLARRGRRSIAVALGTLLLQPALYGMSAGLLGHRNTAQLDTLRWVGNATPPHATVLDGWTGYGVFRPHAWYYFMLPAQVREMIPDDEIDHLAGDLRSGAVAPDLVVLDEEVMSLGPAVTDWLLARYRLRIGPFLARAATPESAAPSPA